MEQRFTRGILEYPDFDVVVMVSMNRIFYLHQHTLKRNSEVFAHLLTQHGVSQGLNAGRKGKSQRPVLLLERTRKQPLGSWTVSQQTGQSNAWAHNENGLGPDQTLDAYSNIFRIMYNLPPEFQAGNVDSLLSEAVLLQDVADHIKALDSTSGPIELALSRLGQSLYKSIATVPWAWIEFARRLKSPPIFKEALIHLVGQYRNIDSETLKLLSEPVRNLAEKKLKTVEIKKKAAELRIMGYYPESLEPSAQAVLTKTERNEYSAAIYHWMTLCYFRQWFGQMISRGFGSTGADGGATLYRWIHAGGEAYLNIDDIQEFKNTFSCSQKANKIIASHVSSLKKALKPFVGQLVASSSAHADPDSLPYLTCVSVERQDFLWTAQPNSEDVETEDENEGLHPEE